MNRFRSQKVDPMKRWRLRSRAIYAIVAITLVISCIWAIAPITEYAINSEVNLQAPNSRQKIISENYSLNHEVFKVAKIWNPPELPSTEEDETKTVEKLKLPNLQLIGIIEEVGKRSAALYYVEHDKVLIVTVGDKVDSYVVDSVTSTDVILRLGTLKARLTVVKKVAKQS